VAHEVGHVVINTLPETLGRVACSSSSSG
jgi:hypothetical protein